MCSKLLCIFCCILSSNFAFEMRSWDYTILEIYTNSSDESKVKFDLQVVRLRRGSYALSGTVIIDFDITEDYLVEVLLYRSAYGNNHYKLHPMKVRKQRILEFIDDIYKNTIAKSIANCSNAPQAEGNNSPVFKKGAYKLESCLISANIWPSHMQTGYYKIQTIGTGPVEWFIEYLVRIETKL